jgi:predicted nucleotidyltransferase
LEAAMIGLIEQYRAQLAELCRKYHVKKLEVFGSAAAGTWDPKRSDLDFLVDFHSMEPGQHAKAYFNLLFALEDLFHCKIDLVETPAVSNPYFLKSINEKRAVLYAA